MLYLSSLRATASASGLFQKKLVEKEYLAIVKGRMPLVPPSEVKCCALSRLADLIKDTDKPKAKQHQAKFNKFYPKGILLRIIIQDVDNFFTIFYSGPRTGPSLFAMDQGAIRRRLASDVAVDDMEKEFLKKKWNDLPDEMQEEYLKRASEDKYVYIFVMPLSCEISNLL